jgi:SAM-dependent methyltransferase
VPGTGQAGPGPGLSFGALGYADRHQTPGYWRDLTRHFPSKTRLLDIGSGSGWLAEHFSDYTGVERDPATVERAVALGRNVIQWDIEQEPLPFDDGAFEGVVLKDVLEHVRDPVAIVREVRRVLAEGGAVYASSPDAQRWAWDDYTHVRPFTLKAYRLLFSDHGFAVERAGYESVVKGSEALSALAGRNRRPPLLNLLARVNVGKRNVWVLARPT